MSAPEVHRGRGLAAVFSLRTISGKLIVGLLVLFGMASVIVSLITANSLDNSLMSSLNQQLVSATHTWSTAFSRVPRTASATAPTRTMPTSRSGRLRHVQRTGARPGTFEALLTGTSIGYKHAVSDGHVPAIRGG